MPENVCIFASFPMAQRGNLSPSERGGCGRQRFPVFPAQPRPTSMTLPGATVPSGGSGPTRGGPRTPHARPWPPCISLSSGYVTVLQRSSRFDGRFSSPNENLKIIFLSLFRRQLLCRERGCPRATGITPRRLPKCPPTSPVPARGDRGSRGRTEPRSRPISVETLSLHASFSASTANPIAHAISWPRLRPCNNNSTPGRGVPGGRLLPVGFLYPLVRCCPGEAVPRPPAVSRPGCADRV